VCRVIKYSYGEPVLTRYADMLVLLYSVLNDNDDSKVEGKIIPVL
jgi:hypothetical protein